jgi:Alpha amylase, catalytic domain
MSVWPTYPSLYEVNTWPWLNALSRAAGRTVTLANVPEQNWDELASLGFNAVWLMGVWERSPAGIAIVDRDAGLIAEFKRALPDYRDGDNVGSPYCVRRYSVDPALGGPDGLAKARAALEHRGMGLVLDFVPNHVAPDHPWVLESPDYFIQGSREDLAQDPDAFLEAGGRVLACGKDPYFPAWPDVVQLNAFAPGLRAAAARTVCDIAAQCDAVRCDMAMLMLNAVFSRTWRERAGAIPPHDYWAELIPTVKARYPQFRFVAEAYWGLECQLQQEGFAYCYDKCLYDRLHGGSAEEVRLHLCADIAFQSKLLRFIENHDEPRAAVAFGAEKERAAAITALSLPGARLVHDGQMDGRTIRAPIFLARQAQESTNSSLRQFYEDLLRVTNREIFQKGRWQLCERSGWPDNAAYLNIVAWCWCDASSRYVIAVNLADSHAQARVRVPWTELAGRSWSLVDALTGQRFERSGDELCQPGLYVDLPPWGCHFLAVDQCPSPSK